LQATRLRTAALAEPPCTVLRYQGDVAMIMLSSLSEYVVLLGAVLLMVGLARLAYGGQPS
jgi:hypothetical protein